MSWALLESVPIIGVFVAVSVLMLVCGEIGFRLGEHARSRRDRAAPASVGPMVGALLGMLAFVLAFTFSMASSQYDTRKTNVLEEANAIGTAFLRGDLLEPPRREVLQRLLREYVDARLQGAVPGELEAAVARSGELQQLIWDEAAAAAREHPGQNTALVVQAVNAVIDMHERRLIGAMRNRIPGSVWIALTAIISLTMLTLGIQVGLTGRRRLAAVVPLVLAFAVLVSLVVDLDRPQSGLISTDQTAMIALRGGLEQPRQ